MELYKILAMATQIIILAVTGIAIVIWMGASQNRDINGIAVGAIFILMAGFQVLFSVGVWKKERKQLKIAEQATEPQELQTLKTKEAYA